ncbi:hypothetical protein GS923_23615 [Rhodococcus hoagii]|nr:hypothetical protein [Prescottella equi]
MNAPGAVSSGGLESDELFGVEKVQDGLWWRRMYSPASLTVIHGLPLVISNPTSRSGRNSLTSR